MSDNGSMPIDGHAETGHAGDVLAESRRALEAIILVATDPVPEQLLAQLLELPVDAVGRLCAELAQSYVETGHGFRLAQVAGGWRYQTDPDLAPYVERFAMDGQSVRLSSAALETLSIVAYKQPISRAQVSAIRGVSVDAVLRTLEQRGYVEEVGRDAGPGQAVLFGTTPFFLERLGLNTTDDLPALGEFVPSADVVEALEQTLKVEVDPDPDLAITPDDAPADAVPEASVDHAADAPGQVASAHGAVAPDATADAGPEAPADEAPSDPDTPADRPEAPVGVAVADGPVEVGTDAPADGPEVSVEGAAREADEAVDGATPDGVGGPDIEPGTSVDAAVADAPGDVGPEVTAGEPAPDAPADAVDAPAGVELGASTARLDLAPATQPDGAASIGESEEARADVEPVQATPHPTESFGDVSLDDAEEAHAGDGPEDGVEGAGSREETADDGDDEARDKSALDDGIVIDLRDGAQDGDPASQGEAGPSGAEPAPEPVLVPSGGSPRAIELPDEAVADLLATAGTGEGGGTASGERGSAAIDGEGPDASGGAVASSDTADSDIDHVASEVGDRRFR